MRNLLIDLGPGETDRYLVVADAGPEGTVMDVLEGRSGTILYRGPDHTSARVYLGPGAADEKKLTEILGRLALR